MGIQPQGVIVRFAQNINLWQSAVPTDANTGVAVVIPTGCDLTFQMFFAQGVPADATAIDYTNIATVYVALQSTGTPHEGTIYWTAAIANGNITNNLAYANWLAGNGQQITLAIPCAQNAFTATAGQQNYWLVIWAVTTDAVPKQIVFSATNISVVNSGVPIGVPTGPQPFKVGSVLNFVCADGQTRAVSFAKLANGRWSLDVSQAGFNGPGQAIYCLQCADTLYRNLSLVLVQGIWTLDISQNGHN